MVKHGVRVVLFHPLEVVREFSSRCLRIEHVAVGKLVLHGYVWRRAEFFAEAECHIDVGSNFYSPRIVVVLIVRI